MVKKWLKVSELGGDPWVLPIWSVIHTAVQKGRMKKCGKKFSDLALHVSIKLNMLPRITNRINLECKDIYKLVKARDTKFDYEKGHMGYAFDIDDDLKYNLLVDVDSLLFEFNSCCELMGKFLSYIYKHTGNNINVSIGKEIKNIFNTNGVDTKWYVDLDKHRNFFIHEGSPYVAIDLSNESKYYDPIFMKTILHSFEDEKKYIKLSQINNIVKGFLEGRSVVQKHIIDYIKKL